MVMGCIHLAFTLGLFSLGGERVARERRESDQLDCSRDSDQLDRSLSRLLPQTLLPNAKGTHSSTSIACLLDQSRGKLPPPFVIDLVDLLRWRRIYSRGTRASTSLSQRSSPVPYSGLPGTSRSNTTVGNRLFKPEPGSSNQNLMPTTTETRSSPSSSRQFRLPPFHAHVCVQPIKAVSESQERDENPTNWIAHETPTNWIALSLDSSLKHYCQMLKALIHPHPLLASLTRAGVSCLLRLL